jgi:hypothetical protein
MEDAVKTTQGKVGITFQDNTKVQVNENSKLVIDDFVYDPKKPAAGKLALNMAGGTVRYASGAIAKNDPSKVAINTPTATIAVRGTDFTATVDELGVSTIILLPSCPNNRPTRTVNDIEKNCKTGAIEVITDAGAVVLNQPFQTTRTVSRNQVPTKPVILKLGEDAMNNLLIISPPPELSQKDSDSKASMRGALDVDFLKENGLVNALDMQAKDLFTDTLSRNFLEQDFLANILDIINRQMAAQLNLLNNTSGGLLPDYNAGTGVIATIDDTSVNLYRSDGSNVQSITVPNNQASAITQTQGLIEVKNRVNSGATTTIVVIQDSPGSLSGISIKK